MSRRTNLTGLENTRSQGNESMKRILIMLWCLTTVGTAVAQFDGGGGFGGGGLGGGGLGGGGLGGGLGQGGLGQGGLGGGGLTLTSAGDVLMIGGPDTLTGQGIPFPLQTAAWETDSYNNIVGPEFGLQFESQRGRWVFTSDFRFIAGLNWQNNLYRGANFPDSIGADYVRATFNPSVTNVSDGSTGNQVITLDPPPLFLQIYAVGQNNATNDVQHHFTFTPIGEWRLGVQYQVSQAIRLRLGYTGMAMGSISRASVNTRYRSVERPVQYAEILDPEREASIDNPWVVKTTGPRPDNPVPGAFYTDPSDPYFRPNPVFNRIGPSNGVIQDIVFANGVDFGIEFSY
jgi:hypothetical protein